MKLLDLLDPNNEPLPQPIHTIVEIGAANGEDTVAYAHRFPKAQIHAFEPLPSNCKLLAAAVQAAGVKHRVGIYSTALSNKAGATDFWLSGGTTPSGEKDWAYSNSLLPPKEHLKIFPWCTFEATRVETQRLDQLLTAGTIIDFMHIDVQGAELLVLEGAGSLLATTKSIWLEVSHQEIYKGQPLAADVGRFLRESGFDLALDALGEAGIAGDQLWVR